MNKKDYIKFITKDCSERLRLRITVDKGKVLDIVVQYESLLNNKWVAIVRYDCAHGFFHRDVLLPNGDKEKNIIAIENMEHALFYSEQDLKDHWELYKEKYIKKIKK